MTDDMMDLRSLVEKSADADLLRKVIGFAAEKLMALEVGVKTGAGYGEKNDTRRHHRASYSEASHRQLFPELPRATPHGRKLLREEIGALSRSPRIHRQGMPSETLFGRRLRMP